MAGKGTGYREGPRRVVLTLEVETDLPLSDLRTVRSYLAWWKFHPLRVLQVQANVIRGPKKGKKR